MRRVSGLSPVTGVWAGGDSWAPSRAKADRRAMGAERQEAPERETGK